MTDLGDRFEHVLSAAARGDASAFAVLWRATHPVLLRYLRVTCPDVADDVASETWLRAVPRLGTFRGGESGFRGWLVVIARNHARDLYRHRARHPEEPTAEVGQSPAGGAAVTAPSASDDLFARESTLRAVRLVATLPKDQAEMVMLRVVLGLDVADVARIVDRTPGAVRVAVHRALRTLAARLTGAIEEHVTPGGAPALEGRDD